MNVFHDYLHKPGPDILVCDEGHVLKNDRTKLFKALFEIETKRRILLTGTPLQNNLKEYYILVNFLRPGFLGDRDYFKKEFDEPIRKGISKVNFKIFDEFNEFMHYLCLFFNRIRTPVRFWS